jgi:hypothetical protein
MRECDTLETLQAAYVEAYKWAKSCARGDLLKEFEQIKDQIKSAITEKLIALSEQSANEIAEWMSREIATLETINNESSFNTLKARLIEDLTRRCKTKCVDSTQMLAHIKSIKWRS